MPKAQMKRTQMKRAPVKGEKPYRKLREKTSNGKAARIANAAAGFSRRTVRAKGGNSPSHEDWNKEQLLRRARESAAKAGPPPRPEHDQEAACRGRG